MRLNKRSSFVLLCLLNGARSAKDVSQQMPKTNLRTVQRSLIRLVDLNLIIRRGINDPRYSLNYGQLIKQPIRPALLEDINRPTSSFNFAFLKWLADANLDLAKTMLANKPIDLDYKKMNRREVEHLMVELAWKSSNLEGNTYSLLETELLLTKNIVASAKTNFETQMVINHKQAIEFVIDNPQLFNGRVAPATVREIHKYISYNLGIKSGIRKRFVRITASNYQPLTVSKQIQENLEAVLVAINKQPSPLAKVLAAFSLIPYLQPFEDGNKRVGRILANGLLIHTVGCGFSLKTVDAKELALAYLSFYEFNSLSALSKIVHSQL